MKSSFILPVVVFIVVFSGCKKHGTIEPVVNYQADVANAWMQMQIRLTRSTTNYNSVVSDRSFGYAGITLYESLVPGIPGRDQPAILADDPGWVYHNLKQHQLYINDFSIDLRLNPANFSIYQLPLSLSVHEYRHLLL